MRVAWSSLCLNHFFPLTSHNFRCIFYSRPQNEWHLQKIALQSSSWFSSGYVYVDANGQPIPPDFVSRHFARIIKQNGLLYIHFYGLRHSTAPLLHNSGYDLKDIQGWLGHSDITTTGTIYSHLDVFRFTNMAQSIGNSLDSR